GTTTEPKAPPPPVPVPVGSDGTCEPGLAACPGAGAGYCFDLQSYPSHCGTCDHACPLGTPCENGQCRIVNCTSRITVRTTHVGAAFFSYWIALADFDGDGAIDFLAPTPPDPAAGTPSLINSVTVFHGKGDGTFAAGQSYPAGVDSGFKDNWLNNVRMPMATADLNHDQIPDIVMRPVLSSDGSAPASATSTIVARLGNGDGTFGPEIGLAAGVTPSSIAVADLDGDGKLDLTVISDQGTRLSVYHGDGDGTFSDRQDLVVGAEPARTVTVADWNSDGIPDLVVADLYLYIHVLLGKGQSQFAPAMDCGLGLAAPVPILADFDRDGTIDLVSGNTVLFGMHDCNATRQATYPAADNLAEPLTAADLNGDGVPDVAFSSDDGTGGLPAIGYLPADGHGNFGSPVILGDIWDSKDKYSGVNPNAYAADVNGDGRLDLLVANQSSIIVFLNTCM
ncbi:MAG TPA: FG-GAP-like repeat-containing protein, partial [Polyangia bacterium]